MDNQLRAICESTNLHVIMMDEIDPFLIIPLELSLIEFIDEYFTLIE